MFLVVNRFLLSKRFVGITLWPFIVMKHANLKNDTVFINHERIHLRQQIEMLILPFFIWYGIEFLMRWMQYKNGYLAYRNISFEREAYTHEKDLYYLKQRSFWSFIKWL